MSASTNKDLVAEAIKLGTTFDFSVDPSKMGDYYDSMSPEVYNEMLNQINYSEHDKIVDKVMEFGLSKDCEIMDIGAGTGVIGQKLVAKGGFTTIDGVDASEKFLGALKETKVYRDSLLMYLGVGTFPPTSQISKYDVIVGAGIWISGHLPVTSFDEILVCMKPGAQFVTALRESYWLYGAKAAYREHVDKLVAEGKMEIVSETRFTRGVPAENPLSKHDHFVQQTSVLVVLRKPVDDLKARAIELGKTFQFNNSLKSGDYYDSMDPYTYNEMLKQINYSEHDVIVDTVLELGLPAGSEIMDIGAGTGVIGDKLKAKGGVFTMDGVDASEKFLVALVETGAYREAMHMYLGEGTFPPADKKAKYDVVVGAGIWITGHIPTHGFDEILDCMKPGAVFITGMRERYWVHGTEMGYREAVDKRVAEGKMKIRSTKSLTRGVGKENPLSAHAHFAEQASIVLVLEKCDVGQASKRTKMTKA